MRLIDADKLIESLKQRRDTAMFDIAATLQLVIYSVEDAMVDTSNKSTKYYDAMEVRIRPEHAKTHGYTNKTDIAYEMFDREMKKD